MKVGSSLSSNCSQRGKHIVAMLLLLASVVSVAIADNQRLFFSINSHLVDTRLDALVNPNSCSTHVHSVFGNINFASTLSYDDFYDPNWRDDAGKADLTTAHMVPNKSMYWAPSMYIYNPADQLYYIVPSFSRSYYRIEFPDGDLSSLRPFPAFLQLIAGDAKRKTEWTKADTVRDQIKWTVRSNRRQTNYVDHGDWRYLRRNIALVEKEDQLEMAVDFPSCLAVHADGTPVLSSPNFRSHAAYPVNNRCPPDFPYHIPLLDLEVRYDLKAMRELLGRRVVDRIDNWHLSTMDQTGAGAHADFVSGEFVTSRPLACALQF
jgi:hypothetical protein